MRRITLISTLAATLLASLASAQDKRRVAVMNFEYGTVQGGIAAIFGTNVDVGKGEGAHRSPVALTPRPPGKPSAAPRRGRAR